MKKLISCLALSAVMLTSSATAIFSYAEGSSVEMNAIGDEYFNSPKYYPEKYGDLTKAPAFISYEPYAYKKNSLSLYVVTDHDDFFGDFSKTGHLGRPNSGYQTKIQMKVDGKWKTVGSTYVVSFRDPITITDLKPYTTYTVRVCMPHYGDYDVNKSGKVAYSNAIKVRTNPEGTRITSASRTKNAVRINWKKVSCAGYKVKMYDSKKKVWRTVKTVRDTNVTTARISGLKKNTKYKFYVQPYGRTIKQYPVQIMDEESIEYAFYYSHTLWGGISNEKTVRTKK